MSLLNELRNKRTNRKIRFYRSILKKNNERDLLFNEEQSRLHSMSKIKKEKRFVDERLKIVDKNRIEKMKTLKEEDEQFDENVILNVDFQTLRNGFLTTKQKKSYLSKNSHHFKKLSRDEQQILIDLFIRNI